jgi:restriction system protein
MLPLLRLLSQGATNVAQCLPALQAEFNISDEEAAELNPSGTMTTFANRSHWARTYLSKAGLLTSPSRNKHLVAEDGRKLLASGTKSIDLKSLEQFPAYVRWRESERTKSHQDKLGDTGGTSEPVGESITMSGEAVFNLGTPDERIDRASQEIDSALVEDLMLRLHAMHPVRFERLILDLLKGMGYGAGSNSKHEMTKASGDGGIDGIINEDALGLDAVYVQAKRYAPDSKVGRPALQALVGSLTGEGANKGVFVTTSDFSREAREYLNKVQHRIVLINGERLARLMIQHEVGVRARRSFVIRSVDEDYFADPEG